jgi:hypothetical protein
MSIYKIHESRFNQLRKREENSGCLLWTGTANSGGYGIFLAGSTKQVKTCLPEKMVHRISWLLAGNEIPEEYPNVLHDCPAGDNKLCSEPSHLWTGTNLDNSLHACFKRNGAINKSSGLPYGVQRSRSGKIYVYMALLGQNVYLGIHPSVAAATVVAQKAKDVILGPWWAGILDSGRAAKWRYAAENKGTTAWASGSLAD